MLCVYLVRFVQYYEENTSYFRCTCLLNFAQNFDNIARLAVDGVDEVWSRDIGMVAGLGCLPSYVCRILLVALARQYLVKTAINTPESVSVLSDWETIREHVATFASSTHSELCQATRALLSEVVS